uniref:Uncharacterized protein n=1 Tax=Arundo donax TaxID=35708 RepID=A0A0A9D0K2_ARUDO
MIPTSAAIAKTETPTTTPTITPVLLLLLVSADLRTVGTKFGVALKADIAGP